MFEVNVFGVPRVTRAVSDLIVASRGRVVNVSSISGVLSSALLALRGPLPAGPAGTMCLVV